MADYKGSVNDGVVRTADGVFIPRNEDNPDWQAFEQWQQAGGVLDAADPFVNEYAWYMDIGPFFDRFGNAKMSVLTSTNSIAKAVVTDVMVRKWIDLKNQSVGAGIDALIAQAIPGVDSTLKASILNTPVTAAEQSAVVKMYFNHK